MSEAAALIWGNVEQVQGGTGRVRSRGHRPPRGERRHDEIAPAQAKGRVERMAGAFLEEPIIDHL